jgi:MFS family permease
MSSGSSYVAADRSLERFSGPGELSTLALLTLGFGLVGIDRFLISTLFPVIAADLHLSYADIGTITGALAIAWALAALFFGNLADRLGRRGVLVGALVAFSVLIGASGLATSLVSLVLVRIVMGLADGAYAPASIAATVEASSPAHHGRNVGIQQVAMTAFGLGLAPILVSSLLHLVNWRWIFSIFALPGLALAALTHRFLRVTTTPASGGGLITQWAAVLRLHNARILMLGMLCWLTCLVTTSALMPSYLLDYLHLPFATMSRVMSAIGFGAAAGTLLLPWLSDRLGRKPIMVVAAIGALLSIVLLRDLGTDSIALLFLALFAVHFFNNSLITLTVGPACTDTVGPANMATASGMVIAVGEIFGGGVAPMLAGQVAQRFGIEHVLLLPGALMIVGVGLCLLLRS